VVVISTSPIRIIAAFVTGVLVALLGAVAYVKIAGRAPSEPVIRSAPVAAVATPLTHVDTPLPPEEEHPSPAVPEPTPSPKTARHATLSSIGHKFSHNAPAKNPYGDDVPQTQPAPSDSAAVSQPEPPMQPSTTQPSTPAPEPPAPQAPPVRQPQSVTLDTGMSLVIRLNQALSSNRNYVGDTFRGTLELPITINGFIISEKGSRVLGRVVNVRKPGRIEGLADLSLALTEINTTDGQRVAVQTSSYDKKGASNTRNDAAKVAGGAALGAIIGAIAGGGKGAGIGAGIGGAAGVGGVLLTHGQAAAIPDETVLTFRLSGPVTITERLN
jgi:hypothetical protein